jgi:hypothetical protein
MVAAVSNACSSVDMQMGVRMQDFTYVSRISFSSFCTLMFAIFTVFAGNVWESKLRKNYKKKDRAASVTVRGGP